MMEKLDSSTSSPSSSPPRGRNDLPELVHQQGASASSSTGLDDEQQRQQQQQQLIQMFRDVRIEDDRRRSAAHGRLGDDYGDPDPLQQLNYAFNNYFNHYRPYYVPYVPYEEVTEETTEEWRRAEGTNDQDQTGCDVLMPDPGRWDPRYVEAAVDAAARHVEEMATSTCASVGMRKLLEVCSEAQRKRLVDALVSSGGLVAICLNAHGSKVVQKLIETCRCPQKIALLMHTLEPRLLDLFNDLIGMHVVEHCLQFLPQYSECIFLSVAGNCVDIATHKHGCRALQSLMEKSDAKYRDILFIQVAANGFSLAQDAYGNYVLQYLLKARHPQASAILASKFRGSYVTMSKQTFSSHVVEHCFNYFEREEREIILKELLEVPTIIELADHEFANYVIKSALTKCKDCRNYAALVRELRPFEDTHRTYPYCRKIFDKLRKI